MRTQLEGDREMPKQPCICIYMYMYVASEHVKKEVPFSNYKGGESTYMYCKLQDVEQNMYAPKTPDSKQGTMHPTKMLLLYVDVVTVCECMCMYVCSIV